MRPILNIARHKRSDAKTVVTGADGFIGSHIVEELVRQGRNVRALVHYNSFNRWGWLDTIPEKTRNTIEIVMGDVQEYQRHARCS